MRRFINLEITGKKENCDEILKNDKIFENKNIVESDQELRKALLISVFLSLSIILQIAESFIFIPLFLPGIKLGLANIVTVIVLYVYGIKEAGKIGIMRIFLAGILRNGLGMNFLFSLSGILCSLIVSSFLKKTGKFSVMGVSIAGANFHMIGQVIVASAIYRTNLLYVSYLPYMLLISLFTGMLTGYFAEKILERVDFKSF